MGYMNKYKETRADEIMGSEAIGHGQDRHRLNLSHFIQSKADWVST